MEKELLDKTLEIIELNKRKKDIINLMSGLDFDDKTDTDDYYNYINLYKRTCSTYNKKIEDLDLEDRYNIEHYILELNPVFNKQRPFSHILSSSDDKYISFRRMFIDLGSKLLLLYVNQPKSALQQALSLLGLSIGDYEMQTDIDDDYVNGCMVSDFTNVLYTEINRFLNCNLSKENKELLMKLKYNLIFLAPPIEQRAIITGFDIPNVPHLVDKDTIYDTGLNYQEYTTELDSVMSRWLEALIHSCLNNTNFNIKSLDLLDIVFIKAFASTLEDYELLDYLQVKHNNVNSVNFINAVNLINEALNQSKAAAIKNKELRQYSRI